MIKLMESELLSEEILECGTYIFHEAEKKKPDVFVKVAATIEKFIQKFILLSYSLNLIFRGCYHEYFFNFVFYMSQSKVRPVRHTALVLAKKIFSSLNVVYSEILEKIEETDTEELTQPAIREESRRIGEYLTFFFEILARESYIPDPWFVHQRSEIIEYIASCMITLPHIYYKKSFEILKKLIFDKFVNIRYRVLTVLGRIIDNSKKGLTNIREILVLVYDRLRDPNTKIVTRAILVFTSALKRYRKFIFQGDIKAISKFLYDEDYVLAKAAASFLVEFFAVTFSQQEDNIHSWLMLSGISETPEQKALCIESFSEFNTVLKDFNLLMDHLLNCLDGKETCAKKLVQVMYYSLYQEMRGESFLQRKNSSKVVISYDIRKELTEIIMENLQKLFEEYQDDDEIIRYILEMVNLIDFDISTSLYTFHQSYLLKKCRDLYLRSEDEDLLQTISNLFLCLCKDYNNDYDRQDFKTAVLNNLFEGLANFQQNYPENCCTDVKLDLHFLRIAKLYENFNLNKFFDWDILYVKWKSTVRCKSQLISCKQYLIWGITEMSEKHVDISDKTKIILFKNILSEFTKSLITILSKTNDDDDDEDLKYDAFAGIYSLHLSVARILKTKKEFFEFRFSVLENLKKQSKILSNFFKVNILDSNTLPANIKVKQAEMWLVLILTGMIDLLYAIPLLENYHLYTGGHKKLTELFVEKLIGENPLKLFEIVKVILYNTIQHVSNEHPTMRDPKIKNIVEFSTKFSKMKCIKNITGNYSFNFIQESIRFASHNEYFFLLYILHPFTRLLSMNENKLCLKLALDLIPEGLQSNKFVKIFLEKIDNNIKNHESVIDESASDVALSEIERSSGTEESIVE